MEAEQRFLEELLNEYFQRCTGLLAENARLTVQLKMETEQKNIAWAKVAQMETGDAESHESETVRIGQAPRVWPKAD